MAELGRLSPQTPAPRERVCGGGGGRLGVSLKAGSRRGSPGKAALASYSAWHLLLPPPSTANIIRSPLSLPGRLKLCHSWYTQPRVLYETLESVIPTGLPVPVRFHVSVPGHRALSRSPLALCLAPDAPSPAAASAVLSALWSTDFLQDSCFRSPGVRVRFAPPPGLNAVIPLHHPPPALSCSQR